MKVLYCALAIDLGGAHGGATHATEVANGLADLGHDLWLVGGGHLPLRDHARIHGRVTLVPTPPKLAWMNTPRVRRIVTEWRPDVVMERFYTFAGGGIIAAHKRGIPTILEVNAPVYDPPGSPKDRIDRATGGMMRRWAMQQCRWAGRIVTPIPTTVPHDVRAKVVPLQWGANVHHFDPARYPRTGADAREMRRRYRIPADAPVIVFVGSFRMWHGAAEAIRAFRVVQEQIADAYLLLVGDGPERATLEQSVRDHPADTIVFTGAVPYRDVPRYLAIADVAVAPFVPSLHRPLQHFGFYWSPLKIFEAMAMGIPVVTTAVFPLTEIVRGAGIAVPERDDAALAGALSALLRDPHRRAAMGAEGRARVVSAWSWEAHCRHLDGIMTALVGDT